MDFSNYDSWKLDNNEQKTFKCHKCGHRKEIEELAHNDECCNDCYSGILKEEQIKQDAPEGTFYCPHCDEYKPIEDLSSEQCLDCEEKGWHHWHERQMG